jgi:hypothetical protein
MRAEVEAIQLTADNTCEVGLFAKSARDKASFTNADPVAPRVLRIYYDGPEVRVAPGQWLIKLADQLVVLDDDRFQVFFEPA